MQRNTEFSRATSNLLRQDQLLDIDHQIREQENRFRRYDALIDSPNSPISREQYETTRDQLEFLKKRRELMAERMRQEEILSNNQLKVAKESITRLNENMHLLNRIVQALDVRAPISGQLSSIDAEVGENINPGQRIGQVDVLDGYKVRTRIDQTYIACMGLFGLAAFTTEQRTREIGTRKVLGATAWQIVGLLARRILVLVLIASVLAGIGAYFAVDEWLAGFAYRAGINPLIFVLAAAVAATVAFASVAAQSWRTANPRTTPR